MKRSRGYQLLELMLVALLMSVVAVWGVDQVRRIGEHLRLESACRSFLSAVSSARTLAVTRNIPVQVRVGADNREYSFAPPDAPEPPFWRFLPPGVTFTRTASRSVTFYSRGTAAPAGSYTLGNRSGEITIIIALSGRARLERTP